MRIKAILLMGGSGQRFGSETPKQFHLLAGKRVYLHTLERFIESDLFQEIILVCPESWLNEVTQETKEYPQITLTQGGTTRQESSHLGLLACGPDTDYVVIHDAVRPFISPEILQQNVHQVLQHRAVDTCIPSADTIVHSKTGSTIDAIPKRAEYLRGQTPQSFAYPLILKAHQQTTITNSSDDCTLIQNLHPIHIVPGDDHNLKITTELDLFLAEHLLQKRQSTSLTT
jgi:2-C-methyl-D-erythritol 4-phosphate cytidylyltransferase